MRLLDKEDIFIKLASSPSREQQGFHIFNTVIENLGYDVMAEYMNQIWISLFTRLKDKDRKTPRFVRCMIISMSLFLVKHAVPTLEDSINSVYRNPNTFQAILGQIWIPNLKTITGYTEVKLSAVASSYLLCESASLLEPNPAAEELWGRLLDGIVTLLSLPEEERVVEEDEAPEVADFGGYQAAFVRLQNAGQNPLKEIKDPKQYSVAKLSSQFRGRFPSIFSTYVSPANQVALCTSYNLAIL